MYRLLSSSKQLSLEFLSFGELYRGRKIEVLVRTGSEIWTCGIE